MRIVLMIVLFLYCTNLSCQDEEPHCDLKYNLICFIPNKDNKIKKLIESAKNDTTDSYCSYPKFLSCENKRINCFLNGYKDMYKKSCSQNPSITFFIPKGFKFKYSTFNDVRIVIFFRRGNETIILISNKEKYENNTSKLCFYPIKSFYLAKTDNDSPFIDEYTQNFSEIDKTKELSGLYFDDYKYRSLKKNRYYGTYVKENFKLVFLNIKKKNVKECMRSCLSLKIIK